MPVEIEMVDIDDIIARSARFSGRFRVDDGIGFNKSSVFNETPFNRFDSTEE